MLYGYGILGILGILVHVCMCMGNTDYTEKKSKEKKAMPSSAEGEAEERSIPSLGTHSRVPKLPIH